jgi:hypothetical protein
MHVQCFQMYLRTGPAFQDPGCTSNHIIKVELLMEGLHESGFQHHIVNVQTRIAGQPSTLRTLDVFCLTKSKIHAYFDSQRPKDYGDVLGLMERHSEEIKLISMIWIRNLLGILCKKGCCVMGSVRRQSTGQGRFCLLVVVHRRRVGVSEDKLAFVNESPSTYTINGTAGTDSQRDGSSALSREFHSQLFIVGSYRSLRSLYLVA